MNKDLPGKKIRIVTEEELTAFYAKAYKQGQIDMAEINAENGAKDESR